MTSAGAPTASLPTGSLRISAGRAVIARMRRGSATSPAGDQAQARRQHRLDADRARRGFGERQPLGLDVLRIVIGADDVDEAGAQRLDQSHALVLAAQRGHQLEKRAVVADVELVERQVVDRGAAGRRQSCVARPRHRLERKAVRDQRGVIACAGQRDQAQVALEHDRLGFARHARQAEPTRAQALRHHPLAAQRPVLADRRDEHVEVARIGHGAAHGARVGDRMRAVAEGDRPRFREQADFGDLLAAEPLGQSGGGMDANLGVVARAAQDEVDHRGVVDRRIGVWAGDKRGHAARGGGGAGAGDGLAMLGPGLADESAHVDEAGRDDVALAVDDPRLGRQLVARDRRADAGDDAVDHDKSAACLGLLNGIDETRVDEGDRRMRRHGSGTLDIGRRL